MLLSHSNTGDQDHCWDRAPGPVLDDTELVHYLPNDTMIKGNPRK